MTLRAPVLSTVIYMLRPALAHSQPSAPLFRSPEILASNMESFERDRMARIGDAIAGRGGRDDSPDNSMPPEGRRAPLDRNVPDEVYDRMMRDRDDRDDRMLRDRWLNEVGGRTDAQDIRRWGRHGRGRHARPDRDMRRANRGDDREEAAQLHRSDDRRTNPRKLTSAGAAAAGEKRAGGPEKRPALTFGSNQRDAEDALESLSEAGGRAGGSPAAGSFAEGGSAARTKQHFVTGEQVAAGVAFGAGFVESLPVEILSARDYPYLCPCRGGTGDDAGQCIIVDFESSGCGRQAAGRIVLLPVAALLAVFWLA